MNAAASSDHPRHPPVTPSTSDYTASKARPLHWWLTTVKARGYTIRWEHGLPHLAPGNGASKVRPNHRDWMMLRQHTHALAVATAHTHPDWWAYASGTSDTPPAFDAIPMAEAADAFACAACGAPADRINQRALAWCVAHHPDQPEDVA